MALRSTLRSGSTRCKAGTGLGLRRARAASGSALGLAARAGATDRCGAARAPVPGPPRRRRPPAHRRAGRRRRVAEHRPARLRATSRSPWDTEVSRLHAVLARVGDEWTIADEGLSRNGSFVNGQRLRGRRRLRDGDAITIGRTLLVFLTGDAGELRHDGHHAAPGAAARSQTRSGASSPRCAGRSTARRSRARAPTARSPTSCSSASRRSRATCARCSTCSASATCRRTASAPSSRGARSRPASSARASRRSTTPGRRRPPRGRRR